MQDSQKQLKFVVTHAEAGLRLDRFLQAKLPKISRSRLKALIESGHARLDGKTSKASRELKPQQTIEIHLPEPTADRALPEAMALEILHEDSDILVINKSAEMVTHPGSGRSQGTLVNALLHHCRDLSGIGGVLRPGIVHRLDRGTSGVLIVAKNDTAHQTLSAQFQDRSIEKTYIAFVWGKPRNLQGRIDIPLGRSATDRKKISTNAKHLREASTLYRVIKAWPPVAMLELTPKTGRTHQLRVHLAELGHPIVGDPIYGKGLRRFDLFAGDFQAWLKERPFQLLHARSLSFSHPTTGKRLSFSAPLREEMREFERRLRALFSESN